MIAQNDREILILIAQDVTELKQDVQDLRSAIEGRTGLMSRMAMLEGEQRAATKSGAAAGGALGAVVTGLLLLVERMFNA